MGGRARSWEAGVSLKICTISLAFRFLFAQFVSFKSSWKLTVVVDRIFKDAELGAKFKRAVRERARERGFLAGASGFGEPEASVAFVSVRYY